MTVGRALNEKSDAMVTGAWVALGAVRRRSPSARSSARATTATAGHWPMLIGNGIANAVAFGMMFGALGLLGPARASVVLTLEAVFTVILATTLLNESLSVIQLAGAVLVLGAAVTVASSRRVPTEDAEAEVASAP